MMLLRSYLWHLCILEILNISKQESRVLHIRQIETLMNQSTYWRGGGIKCPHLLVPYKFINVGGGNVQFGDALNISPKNNSKSN